MSEWDSKSTPIGVEKAIMLMLRAAGASFLREIIGRRRGGGYELQSAADRLTHALPECDIAFGCLRVIFT